MKDLLTEKLRAYLIINNPDLTIQLREPYSAKQMIEDKVAAILPFLEQLQSEGKPEYIIEELCMNELTAEFRPSKFNYIKTILEEEFTADHDALVKAGVLTYEIINMMEICNDLFETFHFNEESEDNRFLKYAIIAAVHYYLN